MLENRLDQLSWLYDLELLGNGSQKSKKSVFEAVDAVLTPLSVVSVQS